MTVDPAAGKPTAEYGGHLYHFCSERCRSKFTAEPENYVTATDPVCGMPVERATAKHFSRHEGQGFYFCSAGCKVKLEAEPAKYLGDRPEPQAMPKGLTGTLLSPMIAAAAMSLSSVSVITNALRLRTLKL